MKNFETFYGVQRANNEIIQPLTRQKLPTSLEQKFCYEVIQEYTNICLPSAWRMQFLVSRNGAVQMLTGKFVKQIKFLAVLQDYIFTMLRELRFQK